jgi:legumain
MITIYQITGIAVLLAAGSTAGLKPEDIPPVPEDGELWAVLVAGSNGWYNYRHQADVCHAYQVVHGHGIPDDHIIVMMYDDIAGNKENPTPGKIINHPNGTDVYKGVPKDYTCMSVNPDVFLKVLRGEETNVGSGKTLNSTAKDNVFVFFADHGAKGLLGFGEHILKSTELHSAIKDMNMNKKYNKLVFYIEACESGSMFEGFLDNTDDTMNVFATTASNATTSSYACYYDEKRKTFLGDVYSVKWLEDSDKENLEKETLEDQYKIVKKETNTSTVCQFGDMSISQMAVGMFQGEQDADYKPYPVPPSWLSCGRTAVPGPEVPVEILRRIMSDSSTSAQQKQDAKLKLDRLLANRKFMLTKVQEVVSSVLTAANGNAAADEINHIFNDNVPLKDTDCYFPAVDAFHANCFNLGKNDYGLRMLNTLVNLCQRQYSVDLIVDAIQSVCDHPPVYGIH